MWPALLHGAQGSLYKIRTGLSHDIRKDMARTIQRPETLPRNYQPKIPQVLQNGGHQALHKGTLGGCTRSNTPGHVGCSRLGLGPGPQLFSCHIFRLFIPNLVHKALLIEAGLQDNAQKSSPVNIPVENFSDSCGPLGSEAPRRGGFWKPWLVGSLCL